MTSTSQNLLIASLSAADYGSLVGDFTTLDFEANHVFEEPNRKIEKVYFLESGIASVIAETELGRRIEVGLFGRDGMTGTALFANDDQTPFECLAQIAGRALVIPAAKLLEASAKSRTLNDTMIDFARVFALQSAFTALATGHSDIEKRLARWLLMVHDRVDKDDFSITHAFLAVMLGVRRQGVTVALQILEGEHLIKSTRGTVKIVNRAGLIRASGGTYGPAEAEYARVTGRPALRPEA